MSFEGTIDAEQALPLIDRRVLDDWSSDLEPDDIRDLLSRVPPEAHGCLNAIRKSATDGDLPAAKRAAHRLKGMAANLGAARLAEVARGIELASTDREDVLARAVTLEMTIAETLACVQSYV